MRDLRRVTPRAFNRWSGLPGWLIWSGLAAALAIAWLMQYVLAPSSSRPEGSARVIDGDSIVVAGREIRLEGIDAPEGRQSCTRSGAPWACGEEARRHLVGLIGGRTVSCSGIKVDQHDRLLAACAVDGRSLNAAMVEDGYALSYGGYRSEEQRARAAKRGLWTGTFERPRDWRDRNMRR